LYYLGNDNLLQKYNFKYLLYFCYSKLDTFRVIQIGIFGLIYIIVCFFYVCFYLRITIVSQIGVFNHNLSNLKLYYHQHTYKKSLNTQGIRA